jgi:hypothetical protein
MASRMSVSSSTRRSVCWRRMRHPHPQGPFVSTRRAAAWCSLIQTGRAHADRRRGPKQVLVTSARRDGPRENKISPTVAVSMNWQDELPFSITLELCCPSVGKSARALIKVLRPSSIFLPLAALWVEVEPRLFGISTPESVANLSSHLVC